MAKIQAKRLVLLTILLIIGLSALFALVQGI